MARSNVREWLTANGFKPGSRGRFSKEMLDAYAAAHGGVVSRTESNATVAQGNSAPVARATSEPKSPLSSRRHKREQPVLPDAVVELLPEPPVRPSRSRWPRDNYTAPGLVRIEGPKDNGWTISHRLKVNGRPLEVGTEFSVKGERGRFRFMKYVKTESGKEWIDAWGGPKKSEQWRSFRPNRIRVVHRIKTTDKALLAQRKAAKESARSSS